MEIGYSNRFQNIRQLNTAIAMFNCPFRQRIARISGFTGQLNTINIAFRDTKKIGNDLSGLIASGVVGNQKYTCSIVDYGVGL